MKEKISLSLSLSIFFAGYFHHGCFTITARGCTQSTRIKRIVTRLARLDGLFSLRDDNAVACV